TVAHDLQYVTRKGEAPKVETRVHLDGAAAPVDAGKQIGTVDIVVDGGTVATSPLVAAAPVPTATVAQAVTRGSPWNRFALTTTIFVVGLVSLRYGTRYGLRIAALAKGARRRRRRIPQKVRGVNRRG
ncbi:MAG TPA: hypothetical protein VKT77_19740, partial [Chthonomonadaceae bacterium]|nr:hypothetical protein [Chthonomonadaceae bacterium]